MKLHRKSIIIVLGSLLILYFALKHWGKNWISSYIERGSRSLNLSAKNLNKVDFAFTEQGEVVWLHSFHRTKGKTTSYYDYQLEIIAPLSKQLIKKYNFQQDNSGNSSNEMCDFIWTGKQFMIANELFPLQFRNPATGEIVMEEKGFITKFPELKAGIGKIFKEDFGFLIHTKDGLKFYYFVEKDWLIPEKEYRESKRISGQEEYDPNRKDRKMAYAWGISDEVRGELYLMKTYNSVYIPTYPSALDGLLREQKNASFHKNPKKNKQQILSAMINPQLVKHFTSPIFLSGKIVYSDSTMCVVKHHSEIGKNGKILISLANKDAKIKQYELRLFKDLQEVHEHELKAYRKDNKLAIVSNYQKSMGVALIDLNKEEIIWEYLPTQD